MSIHGLCAIVVSCLLTGFVIGIWFAGYYIANVSDQIMMGE